MRPQNRVLTRRLAPSDVSVAGPERWDCPKYANGRHRLVGVAGSVTKHRCKGCDRVFELGGMKSVYDGHRPDQERAKRDRRLQAVLHLEADADAIG